MAHQMSMLKFCSQLKRQHGDQSDSESEAIKTSGVVGRERMGTAFPHKKLSGNGVPTREFLRDIFSLWLLNYSYFPLLPFTFHARQTMCQNWTSEFAKH